MIPEKRKIQYLLNILSRAMIDDNNTGNMDQESRIKNLRSIGKIVIRQRDPFLCFFFDTTTSRIYSCRGIVIGFIYFSCGILVRFITKSYL